jgi:hypothetical protein
MMLRQRRSAGALALALFTAACTSDHNLGHQGSGGMTGGGGATSSASGATSTTSSGQAGTGGGCHGDATSFATLTKGPIACTTNSDCCVVVNGCLSESQIVSATDEAQASAAWPYCDSQCNDCIPPPIQVGCDNGVCAGVVVEIPDASPDLFMNHCGVDTPVGAAKDKLHFACGGG